MSLIQALSTLRRVLVARSTPRSMASSKPSSDVALNSITRGLYKLVPATKRAKFADLTEHDDRTFLFTDSRQLLPVLAPIDDVL